ncbi:MAG: hypothetical protein KatS3mg035_0962 [Bacteroidia bacterium]|nr:MAG: hypothetical protein KatS3mg035_0962 [Bacteroidia bacterium]
MKFPKIFYNHHYIEFGNDLSFKDYQNPLLIEFLEKANHNLSIKVEDQAAYHSVWKAMLSVLNPIEAAGGIIKNSENQYLMIFRLGKWDLPKGKIDPGESPEETAIREIEEEVNIPKDLLKIEKLIGLTYHIYLQKNQYMVKSTFWYDIFCSCENQTIKPQLEENITEIRWFTKEELLKLDTYPSIQSILETYFQ